MQAAVKEVLSICRREVPVVPLDQPIHDGPEEGVGGSQFRFRREPDYRQFAEASDRPGRRLGTAVSRCPQSPIFPDFPLT